MPLPTQLNEYIESISLRRLGIRAHLGFPQPL